MVFTFAKLVGLGVTAFVFEATRPKLLQMAWFRWVYEHVLMGLAWAHRLADPIKDRIRKCMQLFRPRRAGRAMRLFWRIRRRMRARSTASEQMHRVRREQPNRHEADAEHAEAAGKEAQRHDAGDDRRRSQHDADLERRRRHLVVVVARQRRVAQMLLFDRAARQLDGAFALAAGRFRLGAIARRGLGPVVDLLGDRRLLLLVGGAEQVELGLLGGDDGRGAADVLRLEEVPEVRRFDLVS